MTRLKYVKMRVASASGVADRWRSQYQHPKDGWGSTVTGPAKAVYDQLCALGTNPDIEAVAKIIGNKSWSHLTCEGCNESVVRAVEIGEYEPKIYCKICIDEAASAFQDETK